MSKLTLMLIFYSIAVFIAILLAIASEVLLFTALGILSGIKLYEWISYLADEFKKPSDSN
jgi:hypothetical protein